VHIAAVVNHETGSLSFQTKLSTEEMYVILCLM
jgi:hypothetical protein